MKLLAVGDIHLGRRPSRLPEELRARARDLGPGGALRRIVEAACSEGADVVALAGDVVERENDFFEAYRELHQGVSRLVTAGIQVVGVAGNHDVQVLPRLEGEIHDFRLLGRGGRWEPFHHQAGTESVVLWGWSFPRPRVTESPLAGERFERRQGGPNLGLLHCDRDQPGSPYGPVTSRELEAAGLDGWLLGHIHKPDPLFVDALSGYLGSVTGMDPSETGARGPWLITIEDGRIRAVEQWVLAPLRWESLSIDLSGISEAEEARVLVLQALRDLDTDLSAGQWIPEAVGLRVTLSGRSRFGEAALSLFSPEDRAHIHQGERDTHYFIERLDANTQPEIPLETLAQRADPAGLLAGRLLLLDRPSEDSERQTLLAEFRRRLETQARDARWGGLRAPVPDEEQAADWLRNAGARLLEHMLAQRETAE